MTLLRHPTAAHGKVHDITPSDANWGYVGFALYRLAPGERASEATGDNEAILVIVEGKAQITASGQDWGELGDRMDVFEKTPPHCLYVPNADSWEAVATTPCTLAVCRAPGKGGHKAQRLGPDGIELTPRGKGTNTRYVCDILPHDDPRAAHLLVVEVITPQSNSSSYPPHKHDQDAMPTETVLEETYYHRLNPPQGFAFQRVYTDDRSLDEACAVEDHDVVMVPRGYHPVVAPHGYDLYYLNVMAGPGRAWHFKNDPAHEWMLK